MTWSRPVSSQDDARGPDAEADSGLAILQSQIADLNARVRRLEKASPGKPIQARLVRAILSAMRSRDALFGNELFGEPAWRILLELCEAELEERRLPVAKLGQATGLPQTTKLRWIEKLESAGWLERVPDPRRKRSVFAVLTPEGSKAMRAVLDNLLAELPRD